MKDKVVISLYDFTGEALKPWAEQGYTCYAYDIQHENDNPRKECVGKGAIWYTYCDLQKNSGTVHKTLIEHHEMHDVIFGMAFPVCTDLAVSGAMHFKKKKEVDVLFQYKAMQYVFDCANTFIKMKCPYMIENPVSVLATMWREPDYRFHPYEYGGYIPEDQAEHPVWPEYIAPRDAYPKKTCLWTDYRFVMPPMLPVEPEQGFSRQHLKLGGKSARTKNIRSATPRGFARAVMEANV